MPDHALPTTTIHYTPLSITTDPSPQMSAYLALLLSLTAAQPLDTPTQSDTLLAMDPNLGFSRGCSGGDSSILLSQRQHTLSGQFSGDIESNSLSHDPNLYWCSGYVPQTPQYCVTVPSDGTWTFRVSDSLSIDTVMALRPAPAADVVWCDDDSAGNLMPMFTAQLTAGTYHLYVGAFSIGNSGTFELQITRD